MEKQPYAVTALLILLVAYVIVLVRTAWVSDDAYITLRSVDNFVHGFGPRWNIAERVQAFTHPLWMFLLSAMYFVTREAYFTSIIASMALSVAALYLLFFKIARSSTSALLAGVILVISKAFTDYSTSSLENPLSHFLHAILVIVFFARPFDGKQLTRLFFVTALAGLTRPDLAPLLLPPVAYRTWKYLRSEDGSWSSLIKAFFIGFSPLIAWEVFSIFYYGFPFPNTAYAKLNTGIERSDLIQQGFCYLMESVRVDPVTLLAIGSGMVLTFRRKAPGERALAGGIILFFVYLLLIGGDFMTGRFLTSSLFLAAVLISRQDMQPAEVAVGCVILLILGLNAPMNPIKSDDSYEYKNFWAHNGITDERGWFYQDTGLLKYKRETGRMPVDAHVDWGLKAKEEAKANGGRLVLDHPDGTIGFYGFFAGPTVHVIDQFALADPLLARLPSEASLTHRWRPGHFTRVVPAGYIETLETGTNSFVDKQIGEYYEKLSTVVSGPLFSLKRFAEIWNFNTGKYDDLLEGKMDFYASKYAQQTGSRELQEGSLSEAVLIATPGIDKTGFLAFGNHLTLKRGKYIARYRLKVSELGDGPVGDLDICCDHGSATLANKPLTGADFAEAGKWIYLDLPFEVKKRKIRDVELRFYFSGGAQICVDTIGLRWED
ncbi:MAG: hypothetical protein KJ626_07350 [Verrucomicrobia bacterium]|nr:hypothetical protein [Verrucomicrobiota bacterium]